MAALGFRNIAYEIKDDDGISLHSARRSTLYTQISRCGSGAPLKFPNALVLLPLMILVCHFAVFEHCPDHIGR